MKKHSEKITVEQLMADYKFDEKFLDSDIDMVGECEVSDMEKQRILQSALAKAAVPQAGNHEKAEEGKSEKFAHGRMPLRKAWAFGLVAALVFAMGGIAVANVMLDEDFLGFLQPASEEQAGELNADGADVMQEVSANGVTVRSRQMVGDGHHIFLLFDVIAPEGVVLDKDSDFFNGAYCMVEGSEGAGYSFEKLDDNAGDNMLSFVLSLDADSDVIGHDLNLEFVDLQRYNEETEEYEQLIPGSWKLSVPCNYVDKSEKHKVGKTILYRGEELKIEDITISPFTVYINASGAVVEKIDENFANAESGRLPDDTYMGLDDYENLKIELKDGSVVNMRGGGNSGGHDELSMSFEFDKMIEVDNIAVISFVGEEIYRAE